MISIFVLEENQLTKQIVDETVRRIVDRTIYVDSNEKKKRITGCDRRFFIFIPKT